MSVVEEPAGAPPASAGGEDRVERSVRQWQAVWPELDVSPLTVFGRVHRVFSLYNLRINRLFGEHDLSVAGFEVLAALYRSGTPYSLSVSALAEETLISSGGMTMRLDRLERDGLVERDRTAADRRMVFVSLTPAGLELLRAVAELHFENESRMLDCLDEEAQSELARLLKRLEAHLSD